MAAALAAFAHKMLILCSNFLFFRLLSSFACRTKACMRAWNKWILKSNDLLVFFLFFLEMFLKKILHLL